MRGGDPEEMGPGHLYSAFLAHFSLVSYRPDRLSTRTTRRSRARRIIQLRACQTKSQRRWETDRSGWYRSPRSEAAREGSVVRKCMLVLRPARAPRPENPFQIDGISASRACSSSTGKGQRYPVSSGVESPKGRFAGRSSSRRGSQVRYSRPLAGPGVRAARTSSAMYLSRSAVFPGSPVSTPHGPHVELPDFARICGRGDTVIVLAIIGARTPGCR